MAKSKFNRFVIPKTTNIEDEVDRLLTILELEGPRPFITSYVRQALRQKSTYLEFLKDVLESARNCKEINRIQNWVQQARFPFIKRLEDFNFKEQPSINELYIRHLASCQFVKSKENIFFVGPPGVGKTHLAVVFGLRAIEEGLKVKYFALNDLVKAVGEANYKEKGIYKFQIVLLRPELLILDEMDFYETDPVSYKFITDLLKLRHENGSLILISNKDITQWGWLFGNKTRGETTIDRLIHHGHHIINITGKSYRMKEMLGKRQELKKKFGIVEKNPVTRLQS